MVLEFYEAGDLSEIVNNFPRPSWQGIMDLAMETIQVLDNADILNTDIAPRNFLVLKPTQGDVQDLMIDFASCELRESNQTEGEWGFSKHLLDKGVIMRAMGKVFQKHNYERSHERNDKYDK